MDAALCTHCQVTMTSWSAPGSPVRYWQCPFCARTHSSLYGEVFRRRAGARLVAGSSEPAAPSALPMPSTEEVRWAGIRARAARWFARLDAEASPAPRQAPAPIVLDRAVDAPAPTPAPVPVAPRPPRAR